MHPGTGILAGNIARLYCAQKSYAEAEPLFEQAMATREHNHGPEDPELELTLAAYTEALRAQGKFGQAEMAQVRSTRIEVRSTLRRDAAEN